MGLYDFGQRRNSLIQMAYTVEDLDASVNTWLTEFNVGPWFYFGAISGIDPRYRGAPCLASSAVAVAYAGTMMIELIQPLDREASPFRESIDAVGFGFHHFGVATENFDEDVRRYVDQGRDLVFYTGVPTGGKVAYFETTDAAPGFLELMEMTPETEAVFTSVYRASVGWDGTDPVRKLSLSR